jgi:hypothetical protein
MRKTFGRIEVLFFILLKSEIGQPYDNIALGISQFAGKASCNPFLPFSISIRPQDMITSILPAQIHAFRRTDMIIAKLKRMIEHVD